MSTLNSNVSKGVLDLTFADLNQFEPGLFNLIQKQIKLSKENATDLASSSTKLNTSNDILNANKLYINEELDKILVEKYQMHLQSEKKSRRKSGMGMTATNISLNTTSSSTSSNSNNSTLNTTNKEISFEDEGEPQKPKTLSCVKAVRVANNNLRHFEFIMYSLVRLEIIDPNEVLWIDVSFNLLETVPSKAFFQLFPNLTTIYLQANKISNLSSTKVFQQLLHLKTISLFGNPIEEMKHYQNFVLHYCPK